MTRGSLSSRAASRQATTSSRSSRRATASRGSVFTLAAFAWVRESSIGLPLSPAPARDQALFRCPDAGLPCRRRPAVGPLPCRRDGNPRGSPARGRSEAPGRLLYPTRMPGPVVADGPSIRPPRSVPQAIACAGPADGAMARSHARRRRALGGVERCRLRRENFTACFSPCRRAAVFAWMAAHVHPRSRGGCGVRRRRRR